MNIKFAVVALVGLIAAADMSSDMIGPLVEAGSTVILGGILAWLIIKRMPARDREHDAAMVAKDVLFAAAVKDIADRQHEDSVVLNKTITNLQVTIAEKQN